MKRSSILSLVLQGILIVSLFSACSHRSPSASAASAAPIKISKVSVSLKKDNVDSERQEVFNALNGLQQIESRTTQILKTRSLFDASSNTVLNVVVDDFRLRHGATRFFTGLWSGSDRIGANVSVIKGGRQVYSKRVEISGGNGNPFAISRDSRGANLFNDLGSETVEYLSTEARDNG